MGFKFVRFRIETERIIADCSLVAKSDGLVALDPINAAAHVKLYANPRFCSQLSHESLSGSYSKGLLPTQEYLLSGLAWQFASMPYDNVCQTLPSVFESHR